VIVVFGQTFIHIMGLPDIICADGPTVNDIQKMHFISVFNTKKPERFVRVLLWWCLQLRSVGGTRGHSFLREQIFQYRWLLDDPVDEGFAFHPFHKSFEIKGIFSGIALKF
jgi:hypothetical protein